MAKKLSQYEKRKLKEMQEKQAAELMAQIDDTLVTESVVTNVVGEPTQIIPEALNLAYDMYFDKETRKHNVVTLSYDPTTGQCKIERIKPVTRQVGLVFLEQKKALKHLVK